MRDDELLERITVRPEVFDGKPVVRGMRIAVEHVLGMLAAGDSADTLLNEFPLLEAEDVQACLHFARLAVAGEQVRDRVLVPWALCDSCLTSALHP